MSKNYMASFLTGCGAVMSGCGLTLAQAHAQTSAAAADSPGSPITEILVTATRREERLEDVPIAISAINAEMMEQRAMTTTTDITSAIPNFYGVATNGMRGGTTFFIRGLGTTSAFALQDPSTSLYIDEVLRPRQNNSTVSFADVERIEVLRGPQGTTFGRNSTGGAVSIVMKKPARDPEYTLEAGYGSRDEVSLKGVANVPLTDNLFVRVSSYYNEADGWLKNLTTGEELNSKELFGARVAARALLSERTTWDLSAEYSHVKGGLLRSFFDHPDLTRTRGVTGGRTNDTVADAINNRGLRGDVFSRGAASNLGLQFDWGTVNFITGYNNYWEPVLYDGSGLSLTSTAVTPTPAYTAVEMEGWNWTQEIKVTGSVADDRLKYVTGVFYLRQRDDFMQSAITGGVVNCSAGVNGDGNITCPNGQRGYLATRRSIMDVDSIAAYGQVDYSLAKTVTATVGVRWTDETKELAALPVARGGLPAGGVLTADLQRYGVDTDLKVSKVTPKATLRWEPTDDQMYYVTYSQGFKSGGFSFQATPGVSNVLFPETTRAYELGSRFNLFDRRLNLMTVAFYQETKDLQLSYSAPNFLVPGGAPLPQFKNAGDIEVYGLEIEFDARLTDQLDIYGSVALQRGEYTRVNPAAGSFFFGTTFVKGVDPDSEPVFLPPESATVGIAYRIPINALSGELTLSGDGRYQGGVWRLATNQVVPVKGYSPHFTVANFGIAYKPDTGPWRLRLDCRNCTDERRITGITGTGYYYDDPRTVMFTMRMDL